MSAINSISLTKVIEFSVARQIIDLTDKQFQGSISEFAMVSFRIKV